MLGITAGARKKGMDDIKSVTRLSVNDLNQLVKDRKKWKLLLNNIVKKRKRTNVQSKEKATANHPSRMVPSTSARIPGLLHVMLLWRQSGVDGLIELSPCRTTN